MKDEDRERMKRAHEDYAVDDARKDALDRELDAALAKYASVEPRAGLEDRVLANLQADRVRVTVRAWWGWSAAAAVLVMAVALLWRWEKPMSPIVVVRPTNSTQEHPKQFASNGGESGVRSQTSRPVRKRIRSVSPVVVTAGPKLDQFPSPQPLTEQELALARYVREFPQEANLIATAQVENEKEIQQKMKDTRFETESDDSNQQER
jgi:hypothetical protein